MDGDVQYSFRMSVEYDVTCDWNGCECQTVRQRLLICVATAHAQRRRKIFFSFYLHKLSVNKSEIQNDEVFFST